MKKNDCVRIVRDIRDRHFEENRGKSRKEIVECYRQKASKFFKVKEKSASYKASDD